MKYFEHYLLVMGGGGLPRQLPWKILYSLKASLCGKQINNMWWTKKAGPASKLVRQHFIDIG